MLTIYALLYCAALVCFLAAALNGRTQRYHAENTSYFLPLGLALVTLVWLLQTVNRL